MNVDFNSADHFSKTFLVVKFPFISFLDGLSLHRLSRVSKIFRDFLDQPKIWELKAKELGLDYRDAKVEVKAFSEMNDRRKETYYFVKNVLGKIFPSLFYLIPYKGIVKSQSILKIWPPNVSVITGTKWETYLHSYVSFIAFSVIDRSHRTESHRIILIIEKTTKLSDDKKAYLARLFYREPCGLWERTKEEQLPKIKSRGKNEGKAIIELFPPLHHDFISANIYAQTFISFSQ